MFSAPNPLESVCTEIEAERPEKRRTSFCVRKRWNGTLKPYGKANASHMCVPMSPSGILGNKALGNCIMWIREVGEMES